MKKGALFIIVFLCAIALISSANETNSTNFNANCTIIWQCTNWSGCIGAAQIRTCLDANACGNLSEKPTETKACGVACEPNWKCDAWLPATCPDSKTQTRNCVDLNQCETNAGMPESAKSCSKNFAWLVIFITIIIIILIIGDIGILKEKFWRRKHSLTPKNMNSR